MYFFLCAKNVSTISFTPILYVVAVASESGSSILFQHSEKYLFSMFAFSLSLTACIYVILNKSGTEVCCLTKLAV